MKIFKKSFQYGDHTVTLETGGVARQAAGSVMVRMGDTVVLVAVTASKTPLEGANFFPLTVHYQEKTYAAGRFPGGFFKREGRPAEHETLTSRLMDRPIRPLFPEGFSHEVQIVATVMSLDEEVMADIPAMIGASAALAISGLPFQGPLGAARVGFADGNYLLNPSFETLKTSQLDLTMAGTHEAVMMVESEASELPEETMLGAVLFGHQQMQVAIQAINELKDEAGKPPFEWTPPARDEALVKQVQDLVGADIASAYENTDKMARYAAMDGVKEKVSALATGEEGAPDASTLGNIVKGLEKSHVRGSILAGKLRIDGRDTKTVRPIAIQVGVLPRAHGSVIFTRGETQSVGVATLGTDRDAQSIDTLLTDEKKTFMLHYNFPPYSVGEAGRMMGASRREIGHGNLAERALRAVLPSSEQFPYTIRVVSEITESNGSSSMATVCSGALSLMDAGVPVKAPVAGIAMGLIKEDGKYAVLTDILGDEDHLGDMDFKVAGTAEGITALQMDIKIKGITKDIMTIALDQAKDARMHILGLMAEALPSARADLSQNAPRVVTMQVDPDKIKVIIGKGGATIREITDKTGVTMDLEDNGLVRIFGKDQSATEEALQWVENLVTDAEVDETYEGVVTRIADFGAFVGILAGSKEGLVHISQICEERVEDVNDYLAVGQTVRVKVIEIDRQGRIRMSMKEVEGQTVAPLAGAAATTEAEATQDAEEAPAEAATTEAPVEAEAADATEQPAEEATAEASKKEETEA